MAWNTGMIAGQAYLGDWVTGCGEGFLVTLRSLRLGGERFTIVNPATEQVEISLHGYTGEDGYFMIPFLWYPEHIGQIDQVMRGTVTVRYVVGDSGSKRETEYFRVGPYISFGAIYKGMGGSMPPGMMPADGFNDVVNYWTDVYAALRKVPVPQILKQTAWTSPEACGLIGDVFVQLPSDASPGPR